jgi:hypothetical protein
MYPRWMEIAGYVSIAIVGILMFLIAILAEGLYPAVGEIVGLLLLLAIAGRLSGRPWGSKMSTATKGRLIALAVVELVIGVMWLFGTTNPAVFAVVTIGLPVLALTVALPIALLIRSNRSSTQNGPPSNPN